MPIVNLSIFLLDCLFFTRLSCFTWLSHFLLECHVFYLTVSFFTWLSHFLLDCHFLLDFLYYMLYSIAWESLSRRLIYYKTTKLLNLINIHLIMCVFHVRVTHVWKLLEIWQKLGRYVKLSVVLILKVWELLHM